MYGSLGFIDNGRRPPHRQASFLGAPSNPARRDMYGARRYEDTVAAGGGAGGAGAANVESKTLALLERRCVYLEEQEKRRGAEVADLRARLESAHAESVAATVLAPSIEALEVDPRVQSFTEVPAGTPVQLLYPMKRIRSTTGASQVWMKRRSVDPALATVTYSWILLFEEQDGAPDRVLVGDFR